MEIDYDKIFRISNASLRLNLSHPEAPKGKKWALQFFLMHGFFTQVYLCMAYNIALALEVGDYYEASRHGIASVIYVNTTFMYYTLVAKRKTILKLMHMIRDDFKKSMTDDEKKIVVKYATQGSNVSKQWLVMCTFASLLFPMKHVIAVFFMLIKGELELTMPYELIYPSPLEENKFNPFLYTFIYASLVSYTCYIGCMYICFVPMGPTFMLHACGQLDIVKGKASSVFSNPDEEEVRRKLVDIVKHLQYIYEFVDCMKDSFEVVYELTLKGTTLLLPVSLYQVLSSLQHGEFRFEFVTFILVAILFSSTPCYYSEMLMEKGEDVRLAIYFCGWETMYDPGARKTILVVLVRALRPTIIRSMFRNVSLETLAEVFQQSYAIFNLMNATWS